MIFLIELEFIIIALQLKTYLMIFVLNVVINFIIMHSNFLMMSKEQKPPIPVRLHPEAEAVIEKIMEEWNLHNRNQLINFCGSHLGLMRDLLAWGKEFAPLAVYNEMLSKYKILEGRV